MKTLVRDSGPATDESIETPPPETGEPVPGAAPESPQSSNAALPLVALVLGIAGVALGVSVIWYFAAVPVGAAAVLVGLLAMRRARSDRALDQRGHSRAVIGAVLGLVAVLLGISGAIYLPRIFDRVDRFIGSVQDDVNANVRLVNNGTQRDVERLDRTLTRDLKRFEDQNKADVASLEQRTTTALAKLEAKSAQDLKDGSAAAKADLATLEKALRADIAALEAEVHSTEADLQGRVGGLEARVSAVEKKQGL